MHMYAKVCFVFSVPAKGLDLSQHKYCHRPYGPMVLKMPKTVVAMEEGEIGGERRRERR